MMSGLTLARRPRRPQLLGFWLAIAVAFGLVAAVSARVASIPNGTTLAALLAFGLALAGVLQPALIAAPYGIWNRVARKLGRIAEIWTLTVCYFLIFPLVGRAGTSMRLDPPPSGISGWEKRRTTPASGYRSLSDVDGGPTAEGGWIVGFMRWSTAPENRWALSLLPFLMLLRIFSTESSETISESNYTLY